jgi:hypothetical protein
MATLSVTLTLSKTKIAELRDAIAANNDYDAVADGTKTTFSTARAKIALTEWANDQFRRYMESNAIVGVDTDPNIT